MRLIRIFINRKINLTCLLYYQARILLLNFVWMLHFCVTFQASLHYLYSCTDKIVALSKYFLRLIWSDADDIAVVILPDNFGIGADTVYTEYQINLKPGDKIFLYTDGITEASDAEGRMYGMNRLLDALNQAPGGSAEEIINNVRSSVDSFVKEAEQFDDLTMLCFEYNGSN